MAAQMFSLAGRRALVTGGSRGIGRAIALGLASAGADVAVTGRHAETLAEAVQSIADTGRRGLAIAADVRSVEDCGRAVAETLSALGGIDILINNAGVEQVCPSLELSEGTWDLIADTNLKGAFFMAQAVARHMKSGGAILNICSLTSERGIPTAVPYGASKTGLLGMTRALAAEWAKLGIRVNALEPGYFRTELTDVFYRDEDWQKAMLGKIPLARFGALDDLVGAAIFLCSPAAAYITGAALPIDGGTLAAL